ncbi:MAG: response regulator [Ignavibacteriales bacterium]|nr:response regulator [Ignavibacteriales bacterium]
MGKLILLAEDDEDNRDLVEFVLRRSSTSYDLIMAVNGEEAVALAKKRKPDLILMDMQMPVMDGWTAVAVIKEDPSLKEIPIIAFTAQAKPEDRTRTRALGCVEHYTKPMDPAELIGIIQKYLPAES